MMASVGTEIEEELSALIRGGELERAATRALEGYGPELFGFLVNLMSKESDAAEVYSQTCEDLWRGLPTFGAQCSVRTWLYVLARHAGARFRRSPWNHQGRRTGDSRLASLVDHARTGTSPWQRTAVKDRWRALRESLDDDDRVLLVLRIDRALPWKDIACVTLGEEAPDAASNEREVERLQKQFALLKRELRQRAREAGLIES